MTAQKSAKPATETVNGLRKSEQLGGELGSQANRTESNFQEQASAGALEFRLNAREVIRAEVSEFNGRQIFNIRRWFRADDGSMRPTAKGLACAVRHLPSLATLVEGALAQARAAGLLDEGDTQ
jgi:hypothetical protein